MNRSSRAKRLYPLEKFGNIEISDDVYDIPDELVLDSEFMGALKLLQIVSIEKMHYEYRNLWRDLKAQDTDEERLDTLIQIETDTYSRLQEIIKNILQGE